MLRKNQHMLCTEKSCFTDLMKFPEEVNKQIHKTQISSNRLKC